MDQQVLAHRGAPAPGLRSHGCCAGRGPGGAAPDDLAQAQRTQPNHTMAAAPAPGGGVEAEVMTRLLSGSPPPLLPPRLPPGTQWPRQA